MIEKVAAFIERYHMFTPGQTAGVAVSGGADSVCLLHILRELAPRWNLRLHVLHFNHRLRGEESEEDARFVRGLAANLGVAVEVRDGNFTARDGNLEQTAREARLAFFQDLMAAGKVDRIAVGHTRSDQAETVLFRFLRGAGTAGLAGIRPVTTGGVVRPLLGVDRGDVEQFLKERGISWREDSTNRSLSFSRNRIRHQLLPELARDWNPTIVPALGQVADWALAEESYWEGELDRMAALYLVFEDHAVLLDTTGLQDLPLAAARRLIRRAMERVQGDLRGLEFAHVNAVLALAESREGHGRLRFHELDIMRSFAWLRFARFQTGGLSTRNYRVPARIPGLLGIPESKRAISLEIIEKAEASEASDCVYNGEMGRIDWDRVSGSLDLRNWRPGDQYRPVGYAAEAKIKTLFQEFRIPLWERRHWPVLTDGNAVVWSRRFGPDARVAATSTTKKFLVVREIGIGESEADVYSSKGR